LGSYFFKKGASLALGPTIGHLVEFWVQLSYLLKFSPRHNQSCCGTWHSTKPLLTDSKKEISYKRIKRNTNNNRPHLLTTFKPCVLHFFFFPSTTYSKKSMMSTTRNLYKLCENLNLLDGKYCFQ
jgi:hypothetical protein